MSACCYRAYIFFSISVQFRGNPPNSRNSGSMQMVENFFLPSRKLYLGCKEVWPIKSSDRHLLILKPWQEISIITHNHSPYWNNWGQNKWMIFTRLSDQIISYWILLTTWHCGPMIISLVGIETTIITKCIYIPNVLISLSLIYIPMFSSKGSLFFYI